VSFSVAMAVQVPKYDRLRMRQNGSIELVADYATKAIAVKRRHSFKADKVGSKG